MGLTHAFALVADEAAAVRSRPPSGTVMICHDMSRLFYVCYFKG